MNTEQGAEAIIQISGDTIIKTRIQKSYRHPLIDETLRKSRTKTESKMLMRLQKLTIPAPKLLSNDEQQIVMEYIDGKKVRDVLETNVKNIAFEIGKRIAQLHANNIIHGDLTTSNMIYKNNTVYLIDFGLSYISLKLEDKAVDLHVFIQALESYHAHISQNVIKYVAESYIQTYPDAKKVLTQLKVVESRGKNKEKKNA